MPTTSNLFYSPAAVIPVQKRVLVALLAAVLLHALVFLLPINLDSEIHPPSIPIQLQIVPAPASPARATSAQEKSARPAEATQTDPARPDKAGPDPTGAEQPPAQRKVAPTPDSQQVVPQTIIETLGERKQLPIVEEGAKSRSTLFDPRLATRLEQERNKVQKFEARSAEYMTANGTFIQNGDRCAEIRSLVPSDIDSNVSQAFKIKCTKRQRPQEDIDRLARKYGIP